MSRPSASTTRSSPARSAPVGLARFVVEVYPKLLWAALAAWLLALPFAAAALRRRLRGAPRGTALLLGLIVAGGLALRLTRPAGHRVVYDEYETLDAARRLSRHGLYAETKAGGLAGWDAYAAPTRPGGHHAVLALALRLWGPGADAAFRAGALLSALATLFVFWAALEAGGDSRGALAAAALWSFSPFAAGWSATADLSSSWAFFGAAGLAGTLAAREAGRGTAAFAALSLALAAQCRPEGALLALWAAAGAPRLAAPALAGALIPLAIAGANRAAGVAGYDQSAWQAAAHAARQLGPNLAWLAARPESWTLALGAALGLRRPAGRGLLVLAAAHLVLYSSFYRGAFGEGAESRYALGVLLPAAAAAGAGLGPAALPAGLLALGLSASPALLPRPGGLPEPLARGAAGAPAGAVVLALNAPAARELFGRPAADPRLLAEDPQGFARRLAAAGGPPRLLLWKDWAWRSRPDLAGRVEDALAPRFTAVSLARDGADELLLLVPRAPGRGP